MFDRGLHLTLQAMRRQLVAMPHDLYLIRLIHYQTRKAFPGERLWNATQLLHPATVRFLRRRNREGCDIYIQPFTDKQNPGYSLVDLDHTGPEIISTMRANGHAPCVVLQTSPGNLQVWVHVSATPLPPAIASSIGKQLAQRYGGDLASTDWRHLGRLAGFTNQKPQRRNGRSCAVADRRRARWQLASCAGKPVVRVIAICGALAAVRSGVAFFMVMKSRSMFPTIRLSTAIMVSDGFASLRCLPVKFGSGLVTQPAQSFDFV